MVIEEEKQEAIEPIDYEALSVEVDPRLEKQELKFLMKHKIYQQLAGQQRKFTKQ